MKQRYILKLLAVIKCDTLYIHIEMSVSNKGVLYYGRLVWCVLYLDVMK